MKRLIPFLAAAAVLAAPATALAKGGVVLKVERGSHLAAVATPARVVLVHSSRVSQLRVGQRVAMSTRRLSNGTLSASRMRVVGRAHRVSFAGLVLARSTGRLTVSAGGAPVFVHTRTPSHAAPGSEVEIDATVDDSGELAAAKVDVVAATAPGGSIEGHLLAIGASSITVGSDGQVLVIGVPSGFDLSGLAVGDEVLAQFTQQADGSLLLTSLTADDAADAANEQGDDNGGGDATQSGDDNGGGDATQSGDDNGGGDATQSGDDGGGDN
jgi:hypothetical protein